MEFEKLPLHDAVLEKIEYEWASKVLTVSGHRSVMPPEAFSLQFEDVTDVFVPQKEHWGASSSINDLITSEQEFLINMQSGDTISVTATAFKYASSNT